MSTHRIEILLQAPGIIGQQQIPLGFQGLGVKSEHADLPGEGAGAFAEVEGHLTVL